MRWFVGVVLALVLLAGAGCSGGDAAGPEATPSPSETAQAFDPLAFEEPVSPEASGMRPFSPREIRQAVDHLAATYTYEARTGFTAGLGRMVSSLDCPLVDEVDGLREAAHHAVMEDAGSEVLEVGTPYRVEDTADDPWFTPIVLKLTIPRQDIRDEDGQRVRVEPAREIVVATVVHAWRSQYGMHVWKPVGGSSD